MATTQTKPRKKARNTERNTTKKSTTTRRRPNPRVAELWETPIEFIDNPEFRRRGAEEKILGPAPPESGKKGRLRAPAGLPPYLASLYEVPLLTKDEEVYYFRRMNYLKFRADRLRDRLDPATASKKELDRLEGLLREAAEDKKRLVRANLRLVVAIAKKYAKTREEMFDLVSDGNVSLMRAVDKFDYGRGFKFSTYATWAIRRNFMRSLSTEQRHRGRFRTGLGELFEGFRHRGTSLTAQESRHHHQREALRTLLGRLGERDQDILSLRFGLEEGTEPLTLDEVGGRIGVTKERVRQLEARALKRLREYADEEKLDIPGV